MDIQHEFSKLLASGLTFSIEISGQSVAVWVGDYLHQAAAAVTVPTIEHAVEWLHAQAP